LNQDNIWSLGSWSEAFNAVVEALAKIGDKKSVKPLLEIFQGGWDEVHADSKAEVVTALGIIGDKSTIEPLINTYIDLLLNPPGREDERMGYDLYFADSIADTLEILGYSKEQLIETLWNEWLAEGGERPNDSIIQSLKDSKHGCKIIRNSIEDLVGEEAIDTLIIAVEIIEHHKISEDLIYILDTTKKNEYFDLELIEITLKALEKLELSIPELKIILKEKKLPISEPEKLEKMEKKSFWSFRRKGKKDKEDTKTKELLIQRIREWAHTFEGEE
jgi:hypothetical protein